MAGFLVPGKELAMASMFIRHRVHDFARWKPVFDEDEGSRIGAGTIRHSLHRDADDPNVVILAFRVDDLNQAKKFAGSHKLRKAMERAGVQGPPEIWFADDVEDKTYGRTRAWRAGLHVL
jgi:hypothetical protein